MILPLVDGGKCDYTIVRPEFASDAVIDAAIEVKEALVGEGVNTVAIKEDFLYGNMKPAELEILVGQTNRDAAAHGVAELDTT